MTTPESSLGFQGDTEPIEANRQHEFQEHGTPDENASLLRRPDSISSRYLTAFTVGPVALQDPSQRLLVKPWRVRADNDEGKVYLTEQITPEQWGDEQELFSYDRTNPIVEVDIAFTQNADPTVVAQRGGAIWIYWFDPQAGTFVFSEFGPGRNPRVLLDDPHDVTNSDVQVFYILDSEGKVVFRQQRDRYEEIYETPVTGVAQRFLEDVYRGTSFRLHLLFSEHNVQSGRYSFGVQSTLLFPIPVGPDTLNAKGRVQAAASLVILIVKDLPEEEFNSKGSVVFAQSVLALEEYASEGALSVDVMFDVDLRAIIINYEMPEEEFLAEASVLSGQTLTILIVGNIVHEEITAEASVLSAESVVP